MSSKDKVISSKLKSFFKQTKPGGPGGSRERTLRPEIERELRPEQPAAQRCKALKDLGDLQLHKMNLDETTISSLWELTKDLIVPNKPAEYRQIALSFYKKLIYTQYKNLSIMRENFFLVIQNHEVHEDLKHRLDLLDTLTENGKDINNFEERIGKFMLHWLPAIAEANLLRPYLDMMVNLIKFNAAHLDNEIVVGIVQVACNLSCSVEDDEIGLQCLTILEMVMCYTIFPSEPLPQCVVTLCRTVNHGPYCKESWKIMRNLLGTQLGYHSMKMMCNILNDRSLYDDQQLLRGAVFHLNMNVFGPNVIFQVSPMFYAATVLKSFLNSLDSRQVNVTFEVILSVRRVITTYKSDLSEIIWDLVCDIMSTVIDNIDYYERINVSRKRLQHLQTNFHENIDIIEKLIQEEKPALLANFERIYDLIERVAVTRPEQSVLSLIEYRSSKVTPTRPEWLQLLNDFVVRYYNMTNPHIRIKLIVCLQRIMDLNRACYEEEILERVVIPHFQHIVQEPEVQIREAVTKALVEFAQHCDTKRCGELLDILEKVINYPFEQYAMPLSTVGDSGIMTASASGIVGGGVVGVGGGGGGATAAGANTGAGIASTSSGVSINIGGNIGSIASAVVSGGASGASLMPTTGNVGSVSSEGGGGAYGVKSEAEILDIIAAVDGLIHVFAVKLHRLPSCHAIKIFNILVGHLEMHYERPRVFEQAYIVRYKIFSWMLKARANALYQIGYPDPENDEIIKFSHYLGTDANVQPLPQPPQQPRHPNVTYMASNEIMPSIHFTTISIRRACKMIVRCLECDPDFQIFQLVIRDLPKVLQNKALIQGNDIEVLAGALFKVCQDGHKIYKRSTDEFHVLVVPAVASLVVYNQYLPVSPQSFIISILTTGFFSNIANVCINTMTTIILEMPEALLRNLPYILLTMSKMSDTTQVAIPVLEFLSILSQLSNNRFTNFVALQYMYVFAISLQFTKPYRFDHYTVLLAHHVIAGWFLKCKLEYRKHVVTYIISSINSNVKLLYDDINKMNEDSTNRKRSTSLTERGSRNTTTTTRNDSDMRPSMNDRLKTFHSELADTCIDFLARHTFSPCSALPKRLPAVEYLLKDGLSQSWIVGHNIVTITTSGCPSAPNRNGLCDRCAQLSTLAGVSGRTGEKPAPPLSPEVQASAQAQHQQSQQQPPQQQQPQQPPQQQTLTERRYTKVSLQHSSGNESAGSTDLTSSSSSASTTQRQTSNSSTASLEAISRRGSNPDAAGGEAAASGSTTSLLGNTNSATSPSVASNSQGLLSSVQQPVCIRSCTGWAEVLIRRPTGNVSWIMRIQNPISNDCFGQDMPFSNMVSLFLPTAQGGVFGPDFLSAGDVEKLLLQQVEDPTTINIPQAPISTNVETKIYSSHESLVTKPVSSSEELRRTAVKVRALQRQEEVSSSSVVTAAIDIPKATIINKRKEALSGSVSDGEADESGMPFAAGNGRARNPVRRVNSSPEMSSSWRHTFLADKPSNAFTEELMKMKAANTADSEITVSQQQPLQQQQQQMQQKKKSVQYSTKDMRVSCEAIPEEIAGSTPPAQQQPEVQQDAKPETPQPPQSPEPPQPLEQPQNLTTDNAGETTVENVSAGATATTIATTTVTAPSTSTTTIAAANFLETTAASAITTLPPKQRSADDISITDTTAAVTGNIGLPISVQQSSSASSLKSHPALEKLVATKPPLSPLQASAPTLIPTTLNPMSQLYDKHINPVLQQKTAAFSATLPTPIGLTKSNSSGGASGLGAHVNVMNNASSLVGNGSDYNNGGGNNGGGDMMRERSKTISVVREVNNGKARANFRGFNASKPPVNSKLCMNPSFVFLQLYNTGQLKCTDVPIKVPQEHTNALNLLDFTPPFETHKIGVLYVGQGQCNNVVEILRNSYGSTRYVEFLRNIGTLVSLKDARQQNIFMCLDSGGADGKFTYVWKDDIVQVIFQVATLMPTNLKTDPNCNEKKKHVGNDYVNIVYNESGEDYNLHTISGQFNYACVIVEPLELNTNRIYVKARKEISEFVCHPEPKIVSDRSAPMLARQLALHANLASQVYWSLQKNNPYGSNWLERLRCIKRLRTKLLMESQSNQHPSGLGPNGSDIDNDNTRFDFTRYT